MTRLDTRTCHAVLRCRPVPQVYITDDGANVGFFKFVADVESDMSRGHLYVAKVRQVSTSVVLYCCSTARKDLRSGSSRGGVVCVHICVGHK